jgi:hypothetical protein
VKHRVRNMLGMNGSYYPKKIAVLGCGPSGLFAAHALIGMGHEVRIFSKKRKSEMFGAQYLHAPIAGLTDGMIPIELEYKLIGTVEGYREKVYGRQQVQVSPEALEESHQAWDIREAYGRAWNLYADLITNVPDIGPALLGRTPVDLIVSSLPAKAICKDMEHRFSSQEVWAIGDAPERGIFNPISVASGGQVILNGERDTGWYRTSNVFFHGTTEWPGGRKPPIEGVAKVEKPISTDCNCHPNVLRVGRYGRWTKGVLSHEAYYDCLGVQ